MLFIRFILFTVALCMAGNGVWASKVPGGAGEDDMERQSLLRSNSVTYGSSSLPLHEIEEAAQSPYWGQLIGAADSHSLGKRISAALGGIFTSFCIYPLLEHGIKNNVTAPYLTYRDGESWGDQAANLSLMLFTVLAVSPAAYQELLTIEPPRKWGAFWRKTGKLLREKSATKTSAAHRTTIGVFLLGTSLYALTPIAILSADEENIQGGKLFSYMAMPFLFCIYFKPYFRIGLRGINDAFTDLIYGNDYDNAKRQEQINIIQNFKDRIAGNKRHVSLLYEFLFENNDAPVAQASLPKYIRDFVEIARYLSSSYIARPRGEGEMQEDSLEDNNNVNKKDAIKAETLEHVKNHKETLGNKASLLGYGLTWFAAPARIAIYNQIFKGMSFGELSLVPALCTGMYHTLVSYTVHRDNFLHFLKDPLSPFKGWRLNSFASLRGATKVKNLAIASLLAYAFANQGFSAPDEEFPTALKALTILPFMDDLSFWYTIFQNNTDINLSRIIDYMKSKYVGRNKESLINNNSNKSSMHFSVSNKEYKINNNSDNSSIYQEFRINNLYRLADFLYAGIREADKTMIDKIHQHLTDHAADAIMVKFTNLFGQELEGRLEADDSCIFTHSDKEDKKECRDIRKPDGTVERTYRNKVGNKIRVFKMQGEIIYELSNSLGAPLLKGVKKEFTNIEGKKVQGIFEQQKRKTTFILQDNEGKELWKDIQKSDGSVERTYTDSEGNEVREYKDGEDIIRETKKKDGELLTKEKINLSDNSISPREW